MIYLSLLIGVLCLWIDIDPTESEYQRPEFEIMSKFFGLWHEHRRGGHHMLHEFYWRDNEVYILILNTRNVYGENNYKSKMPIDAIHLDPKAFQNNLLLEPQRRKMGLEGSPSTTVGLNCNEVGCFVANINCLVIMQ